jgi:Domain of unknown function (DUF4136)
MLSLAAIFTMAASQNTFAQDVRYNYDSGANFSSYKTYNWVDNPNAEKLSDLADRQFKAAMDAELAKKGLAKVDSDDANLYISYQTALQQEKQYTSYNSGWGYGPGWRGYGGTGITTGQTATIHIGAIDLDLYDAAKKQLVWEGTASKVIDPKAKPDKQQKNLEKVVAKLLKNYPSPPKKT